MLIHNPPDHDQDPIVNFGAMLMFHYAILVVVFVLLKMYPITHIPKHCMYQIMHIPKHLNILKHFIEIIIYKNNMYQCVPHDGAFIFLLGRRLK